MDTQTQIERLIELAIVQRTELKQLVAQLPQLREHLNAEIERVFEETEPQLRVELEEFVAKQAHDRSEAISAEVQAKIGALAQTLQDSAQAKFSALMAERAKNGDLLEQAENKIALAAKEIPAQVKDIVAAELARFPRAGEIDQLRKEFAEPKGLNPRGKWSATETYNRLDLVSYNGDSFVSNVDGNREKPSRTSEAWTLNAARGIGGGGGGVTSLTDLVPVPANGQILIGNGSGFVENTLTAGTGVTITNGAGSITIDASGAQELLTATVVNAESVPITRGQVVYLYSATGFRPSVKLAANTSDATSAKTFGIVSDNSIAAGAIGTVTCVGVVDKLMLGAYNDGDTVYLGATAGTITTTKPYAPNHLVYVGIIERANNGNGEIYVKVQNGYELDEIHDVQITSAPAAGALLMRDATNSLWKANRLTAGTNIAVTNADTSVTIGLTGTVAVTNGGTGVTTSTGTGSVVLSNTPTLVTPVIGAATGTSLALTGNITSPDHIFGTSGPSAKSSIASRAARQGLVFDGTSSPTVTVPAVGSADFSVGFWVTPNTSVAYAGILSSVNGGVYLRSLTPKILNESSVDVVSANTALTLGKAAHVVYTRSGTTGTWYINGVASGSGTDSTNYSVAWSYIGSTLVGTLGGLNLYNRALSAAEVVSLFEAGVPAAADYNSASNTALNTGFANSGLAYTTFSGASATGFTATSNGSGLHIAWMTPQAVALTAGQRFLVTLNLTLNSGTAPSVSFGATPTVNNLKSNVQLLTSGANSFVLTATAGGTSDLYFYNNSTATNYSVSSVSVTRLGLLLAPDAAQAGGGLTWYDTSGNAANITLPASGVSWAVPSSAKTATGWTFGGNLTVSGTGTSTIAGALVAGQGAAQGIVASKNGSRFISLFSTAGGNGAFLWDSTSSLRFGTSTSEDGSGFSEQARLTSGGNLLLGTPTDSGNGKIQLASHTTSAGGIGFGTGVSLFTSSTAGQLVLRDGAGTSPFLAFYDSSNNNRLAVGAIGTTSYVNSVAGALQLWSANTLALTLDSSQNATFAGSIISTGNSTFKRSDNTGSVRIIPTSGVSAGSDIESYNSSGAAWNRLNFRSETFQVFTGSSGNTLTATFSGFDQSATFVGTVKSTNASTWAFYGAPSGGADRDIAIFGVSGVTNGFTVRWSNSTSTIRINLANLPTSSVGLAAGDLYNSAGTIKIA